MLHRNEYAQFKVWQPQIKSAWLNQRRFSLYKPDATGKE